MSAPCGVLYYGLQNPVKPTSVNCFGSSFEGPRTRHNRSTCTARRTPAHHTRDVRCTCPRVRRVPVCGRGTYTCRPCGRRESSTGIVCPATLENMHMLLHGSCATCDMEWRPASCCRASHTSRRHAHAHGNSCKQSAACGAIDWRQSGHSCLSVSHS